MPTVLITGGTGLIGTALSRHLLGEGYNVIIVSRNPIETAAAFDDRTERKIFRSSGRMFYSKWDIQNRKIDASALREADYIVHLAGAGVADKRWTEARKNEIRESRTRGSELLVSCLRENPNKIKAVVSASAIGWYGPDKGRAFTEIDPPADDFLGETCRLWENSIDPVHMLGKRLVKLRLGIVLTNKGGALREFKKPLKMGVAAIMSDGKQVMSWVHVDDLCRAFVFALENEPVQGVYNVTAPEPVTNDTLIKTLARKNRGKFYIPVNIPSQVLKLMLGEMSVEVLKSARVSSEKIRAAGFNFIFPDIELALDDLAG